MQDSGSPAKPVVMVKLGEGGLPKLEQVEIEDVIKRYEEDEKAAKKEAWEARPMWLKKYTASLEKANAAGESAQ